MTNKEFNKPVTIDGHNNQQIIWSYPQIYDRTKQTYILLALDHTRAVDLIRIKFDSERDGYTIEQEVTIADKGCSETTDDWQEVAFIKAWQLEKQQ